jgi:acyl-CoA dehydrogenase
MAMSTYKSAWMNQELHMLQESARRFFETECAPHEERWWKQQMPDREVWNKLGDMGLLCASIPEEYGGGGGSFLHEAVILYEQARALVTGISNAVHSGILAHYISNHGTEEQKKRWLPKMATGELVGAIAMSEPEAGSDLKSIRTRAVSDGERYLINGSKTFITNGYHANLICVVCKTDPARGAKGVSLIMIETDDLPGFRRGRLLEKIGQKSGDTAELFFEDMRVPVSNLLGGIERQGFAQLMQELPRERMYIAVQTIATMEKAIDVTTRYARDRIVFDKPLIEMQNTRFKLAECKTEAHIAKVFVDNCIDRLMKGELDSPTASMAKWWCTQKNCEIIDECLQLHGGYGYVLEYPIARMYANARVGKIYGGSNEIMKELIARTLD